jgi:hypothetical protein
VAGSGKFINYVFVSTPVLALWMVSLFFELYTVITVTGGRAVQGVRLMALSS